MAEKGHAGEILTVTQLAEYLQLNKLTIYRYIREGRLTASKFGKTYRIRRADVDKFLESQRLIPAQRQPSRARGVGAAAASAKPPEEIYVGPQPPHHLEGRDLGLLAGNPLEWVIRNLH